MAVQKSKKTPSSHHVTKDGFYKGQQIIVPKTEAAEEADSE